MAAIPLPAARFAGVGVLVASLAAAGAVATASGGRDLSTLPGDFAKPRAAAFLPDGSVLVADSEHHQVTRVADGKPTVVAGAAADAGAYGGDGGDATQAGLNAPAAVAPLPGGGFLIADTANHRIRKVDASGTITTVAGTGSGAFAGDGGPAADAAVNEPGGIVALDDTDFVFADTANNRVRRVEDGTITTVTSAVTRPSAVAVRPDGTVVVADTGGGRVVTVGPDGQQAVLRGGAGLNGPKGVALQADGDVLVSDTGRHTVLEVRSIGAQKVVAGTGSAGSGPAGPAAAAALNGPEGLAVDAAGRILIASTQADAVHLLVDPPEPEPTPSATPTASPTASPTPTGPARADRVHDDNSDGSKNGKPKDDNRDGSKHEKGGPAAPALGKAVTTEVARGTVRIRKPGASGYAELDATSSIPVGSVVDATQGAVRLTAASDASGATQTATFADGAFKVTQGNDARPVTELTLAGPKPRCPAKGKRAGASAKGGKKRRLWGEGKGRFRTKGQHSSATVRGTKWLTEDRCDGTLVRVVHGVVDVRPKRGAPVVVRAGGKHLAKAPRARRRASR